MGASENLLAADQTHISTTMRELYNEIHIAAERLNRLVANLLDMTRLESGMIQPKLNWCVIRDIINATLKGLDKEIIQHTVTVTTPEDLPMVKLDFGLMEQALTNLVYNASIHTPPGTQIDIQALVENDQCIITVTDNGPGIPKSDINKVFEKFYRAEGTSTGGTGLGLPIAKGFIEAHKGSLSVRNRTSGGTEFKIEIPIEVETENR